MYKSSFKIKPSGGTSINDAFLKESIRTVFNRPNNSIDISYTLRKASDIEFKLYDIQGKKIKFLNIGHESNGEQSHQLELSKELCPGIYYVSLIVDDKTITTKLFIQ